MSRRNQARRRRTYGRRQHDLRQRRGDAAPDSPGGEGEAMPGRRYRSVRHLPETREQEEAA